MFTIKRARWSGFTLIQLLPVIASVGILAAPNGIPASLDAADPDEVGPPLELGDDPEQVFSARRRANELLACKVYAS
jgi:hypothetical protein